MSAIRTAEVVLPCADLHGTLAFFVERLGFAIESVFPADAPRVVVISGHGVRLRLQRGDNGAPAALRLGCDDPAAVAGGDIHLTAPNGTRIELVVAQPPIVVPPLVPRLVVSRIQDAHWGTGRAGMRYRDLVPGGQGGAFVVSHIRIEAGGPVPDYVHFHAVRLQMIYCYRGRVRVVYEGQGEPFWLDEGDCVLQPPRIRHRVLECTAGLEVVEVTCPADHVTFADRALGLPTAVRAPERVFDGQRFVHHRAASAAFGPARLEGFEARDLGIADASAGLAAAHVLRAKPAAPPCTVADVLRVVVVTRGQITLRSATHDMLRMQTGDALTIPAGTRHALVEPSADAELLDVALPMFGTH